MSNTTSNNTTAVNGGIGFVGALTITFIVLKLTGVIAWSWWWVISPCWITAAFIVLLVLGGVGFAVIAARREDRHGR